MPKIKPTTLFNKRTLPILLVDDSKPDSMVKAAMLIQPLVDELVKQLPKADPKVVHVENTGNAVFNALRTIDSISTISEPTIIVAPGSFKAMQHELWKDFDQDRLELCGSSIAVTSAPLDSYIKFLVAAGGGFIIHVTPIEKKHELNPALPILYFNPNKDSYMDIEYKVQTIIKKMVSPDAISHCMTIQSASNNPRPHNKLALCLGSWGRSLWDDEPEGSSLTTLVNVKGHAGSPITVEEFINKVWCSPRIDTSQLNPANALVLRNPSIESKLVLAKVLSHKPNVKNIKFIEV